MKIVSIHQPSYLPWFGLIDKIARSDLFVILDNVQYNKRSFQNRTLYSSPNGAKYLSLSVKSKNHQRKKILLKDVELSDLSVPIKHFETLRHRYNKSKGWSLVEERLASILLAPSKKLLEINLKTLLMTLEIYRINPEIVYASMLGVEGKKTKLMLEITRAVSGRVYLSGQGSKRYMDEKLFHQANIRLAYQNFSHPVFSQSKCCDFIEGCLAIEWYIEDPDNAVELFHKHLCNTGEGYRPRSILGDVLC